MNRRTLPLPALTLAAALALPALFLAGQAIAQTPASAPSAAVPTDAQGPIPDIRDIREPVAPPVTPWERYLVIGALALGLLALAYGAWRGARGVLAAPHRVALDELRDLEARAPELTPEGLTDAIADIVRIYVERRFAIHAPRRTTEELLVELATHPALRDHAPILRDLLDRCDRVRFACDRALVEDRQALVRTARTFVRDSASDRGPTASAALKGATS